MKEVRVKCPICDYESSINIPEEILSQKKFGIFKIEVPAGAACRSHRFIVFVDTKGIVRGYERIDVLMEHEQNIDARSKNRSSFPSLSEAIKIIGLEPLAHLMHARIFDYKRAILIDNTSDEITEVLKIMGNIIMPREYRGHESEVNRIKIGEYDKEKFKDFLVIDLNKNIINIPWTGKAKFEEEIIKKALEIFNPKEQLKLLQRDIKNFIHRAENTKLLMEEDQEQSKSDLIRKITKELRIPKLSKLELNLIFEFIKNRYP
ncbi:MAG: hypothetical protein JW891_07150 [Candidatus Lokiarchaeota archaeon]|nr:hypothetical protein [Candidatus Lokiarchaeota archaeon]